MKAVYATAAILVIHLKNKPTTETYSGAVYLTASLIAALRYPLTRSHNPISYITCTNVCESLCGS